MSSKISAFRHIYLLCFWDALCLHATIFLLLSIARSLMQLIKGCISVRGGLGCEFSCRYLIMLDLVINKCFQQLVWFLFVFVHSFARRGLDCFTKPICVY